MGNGRCDRQGGRLLECSAGRPVEPQLAAQRCVWSSSFSAIAPATASRSSSHCKPPITLAHLLFLSHSFFFGNVALSACHRARSACHPQRGLWRPDPAQAGEYSEIRIGGVVASDARCRLWFAPLRYAGDEYGGGKLAVEEHLASHAAGLTVCAFTRRSSAQLSRHVAQ
eukprot:SAG11_NODE_193_length_12862_cov_7.128888_5_plen_169_part_00